MKKENGVLTGVTENDLELLKSNPEAFWAGVTKIGRDAFIHCKSIEEIIIPKDVTEIGTYSFQRCKKLRRVVIPESVTEIREKAFQNCSCLNQIVIPQSITSISWGMFWGCTSLTGVTIPNSVEYIDADAFTWCTRLKSIVIPNSVSDIGEDAFLYCKNLERVILPDGITEIEEDIFAGCDKLRSISIPLSLKIVDLNLFKMDDELGLRDNKFFKEGEFIVEYEKGKFAKIKSQDVLADEWVEEHEELDRLALKEIREMVKEKVQNGELKEVPDPRIEVNNAKIAIANAANSVSSTMGETITKKEVEEPRLNKLATKEDEKDPRDR